MKNGRLIAKGIYELDLITFNDGRESIAALTRKNADFINAVVNLDSNYKRDFDKSAKPKGKYRGSISYWFNEIKSLPQDKCTDKYKECILEIIIAIDRYNSTHLESATNGREEMKNRVINRCNTPKELMNAIRAPFSLEDKNHLITLMAKEMKDKKNGERCNLSFASKFCSYAALNLLGEDLHSKYDCVVSKHLSKYAYAYLGTKCSQSMFDANTKHTLEEKLAVYNEYIMTINEIIEAVSETNISKDEFDHIVWYCNK